MGIAACQIASALHMNVYGTAGTPAGTELVRQNGAKSVFDHKDPDHSENLKVILLSQE